MGRREQNAARTRRLIKESAFDLFGQVGYEATTMDAVAQRAAVGYSTLYRHFPTKERLVIAPLGEPGKMAAAFEANTDLDIDVALGRAVIALLETFREVDDNSSHLFDAIVAEHSGPEARLMEWLTDELGLLTRALAKRTGLSPLDPEVSTRSWMAAYVLSQTREHRRQLAVGTRAGDVETAKLIMKDLQTTQIRPPRLD